MAEAEEKDLFPKMVSKGKHAESKYKMWLAVREKTDLICNLSKPSNDK